MEDGDCLVFVEVRYRGSARFGDSLASVTRAKQMRLLRAARVYLAQHPQLARRKCRFDVVAVSGPQDDPRLRWVRNAFESP